MAKKRIRGITIELDGETKGLDKALQDVNKRSRDLQSELREVDNALKFNPDNVKLLAQKQQLLTEQIETTTEKLNKLKSVQEQVENQYKSGEIGAEQYRAFQREVIRTESKLNSFKKELAAIDDTKAPEILKQEFEQVQKETEEAKDEVKELGNELLNMAAGLAAGMGIAEIVEKSLDFSSLDTKIEISFDVPEESKKAVKEAINSVVAYGVDAESALEGVRRQWALNADASDEANARIVEGAGVIASSYEGIDFTELIQEINEISGELNITNEEALGLTNALLKVGFPPEQLDIIAEYGQQLVRAGYSAEEVQAIMAAGVDTGTWNIDNLLDGLKEGRIRLSEFGEEVPKATQDLLANTDISTKQMQEWGQAVAEGGEKGNKAMQEVAKALMNIEDDTTRNALGVEIFGTMWEDQGENITDTILNMNDHLTTAKDNQDQLNDATEKLNADPAVQFKDAIGELKLALEPLLGDISNLISKVAEWIKQHPQLAATITVIVSVIGILAGLALGLIPIFTGLSAAAAALNIGLLPLTGIILAIVAAIGAIIAIGFVLYKNWDTIKEKAKETWENIKQAWENLKAKTTEVFQNVKQSISDAWQNAKQKTQEFLNNIRQSWENLKTKTKETFDNIKNGIIDAFKSVKNKVETIWSNIWEAIKKFINKIIDGMNAMIGGLNKLKFKAPDWVPVIGGKSFGISIPKIPRLARGGVVSEPTLAMVGDAGHGNPEIVAPKKLLKDIMKEVLNEMQPRSKQPVIFQLVTPDTRILAEWLVDDITELQNFKQARINLFKGR